MIEFSIIILNYNTKELLKNCLTSVIQFTKKINYEIIVVDNASSDGSEKEIRQLFKQVIWIQNKNNFGFAKANNIGIKKAKGKFVILLNSDTKIESDAFTKLVEFANKKNSLGIAGPRLLNADKTPQPSVAPFYTLPITAISLFHGDRFLRQSPNTSQKVDWVTGACFIINRQLIEKIGLLDEHYFMYIEEMEYCYRAKKAGFTVWYFPEVDVYHLVRGSSPEGKQKVIWWIYEGLQYFYEKHFAPWQLSMLKLLLRFKAAVYWFVGVVLGNQYLRQTYAQAYGLVK